MTEDLKDLGWDVLHLGPHQGIKSYLVWRRADKIKAFMRDNNIRKIEIEQFQVGTELTFYWADGNTEEPWGPQELVRDAPVKTWIYKTFGRH